MGSSGSKRTAPKPDSRGLKGFLEDLDAANRLSPCFRNEGCQLLFVLLTRTDLMNDFNYKARGLVGVRRSEISEIEGLKAKAMEELPSSPSATMEGFKVLHYNKFILVLKRMQAEAEVALQIQMNLRGWVQPDLTSVDRVMVKDGRIVTISEARNFGLLEGAIAESDSSSSDDNAATQSLPANSFAQGGFNKDEEDRDTPDPSPSQRSNWVAGPSFSSAAQPDAETLTNSAKSVHYSRSILNACNALDEDPPESNSRQHGEIDLLEGVATSENPCFHERRYLSIGEDEIQLDDSNMDACEVAARCDSEGMSGERDGSVGTPCEGGNTPQVQISADAAQERRLVTRKEYECMICLQTTGAGISLSCLHGPFCEGCIAVWSRQNRSCPACRKKTGYDDLDCWVHLEEPSLDEMVEGLYNFIRKL